MPGSNTSGALCQFHLCGVPVRFHGVRFYQRGCKRCEEKRAADPSLDSAPTPSHLKQTNPARKGRPYVDWEAYHAGKAAHKVRTVMPSHGGRP